MPLAELISILLVSLASTPAPEVDYLRDVKPLLAHKCYACHGALRQQGSLRLDTGAAIRSGGALGAAVTPGEPDQSLLLDVVTGDAGFRMPPESEGPPLTKEEIAVLRSWIASGAESPENEQAQIDPKQWWSYRPIARPPLPPVKENDWPRGAVDRFIAAEREQAQLPHAPDADGATWLRRVSLDLTGLPPTREELHQFLASDTPRVREAVVDELLSRPQYGERWGRHWMDIWRYSDWYGSRGGNEIRYSQRHIWRWRDWIVRSLNDDKPYHQMVCEMLAGDEIAGDDLKTLPATGYLGRNWYKFDRNVWLFETVERTGEAMLGLTLRCCRCHDHKFDPVSQEEYYRFRAFFEPHDVRTDPISALTGTQKDPTFGQVLNDGVALVYDKDPEAATYRFERGDGRYPDKSKPLAPGVPAALGGGDVEATPVDLPPGAWYPALRPGVRDSFVEKAAAALDKGRQELQQKLDAVEKAKGQLAQREKAQQTADATPQPFLHDDFSGPRPQTWKTINGDWVYENGKLIQRDVTSFATIVTKTNHPADFTVHLRYRPLQPGAYRSVGFSFDFQDKGNSQDVYTSTGDKSQSVQAFHRVGGKQSYPKAGIVQTELKVGEEATLDVAVLGSRLTIDLNGERKLDYVTPVARRDGKFALWVHQGAVEFLDLKVDAHVDSLETLQRRVNDAEQAVELARLQVRLAEAEVRSVQARLKAEIARHYGDDKAASQQLALVASKAEREVAVAKAELELLQLQRRKAEAKEVDEAKKALVDAVAAAKTPSREYSPIGDTYPQTSTGRRTALANWIASPQNPRTARVAVNHIWGRHFGRPLVATPENFGLNGRKPTHPKLLDWLASELIASGWRMKALHRQIVLSRTYAMSSKGEGLEDARKLDGENKLLWRMNARRMEAEVVRDSTLYLAGRLDLTQGGPEIPENQGEQVLRRSLYFRNTPNEKMKLLEVFDMADPNSCYRRKESVVPHQSLALMNSGLAMDNARVIAERLTATGSDFVEAAFETVLSRSPSPGEAARCREFLQEHQRVVEQSSGERFPAGGTAKNKPATDAAARARENLVHVLLLHNDFVTVR